MKRLPVAAAALAAFSLGLPAPDSAAPVVNILDRYSLMGVYEVRPVSGPRADYSGVTVRERTGRSVRLWLIDDKAPRVEMSLSELRLALPGTPSAGVHPVTPVALRVENPRGLATGDDIEDVGWLAGDGVRPGLAALVGERGPQDAPVSWAYLVRQTGRRLVLVNSYLASPEGEEVGNNGLEGVAIRVSPVEKEGVELLMFKERPAPTYVRQDHLVWTGTGLDEAGRPTYCHIPEMKTQAGAAMAPDGRTVYVIDRQMRRIAVVPAGRGVGLDADSTGNVTPVEWLDFAALDDDLEGRTGDAPLSLFGVAEGIALDDQGWLYLVSDNNEVRHSRLLVLKPKAR